jgi:hypothetical protein
MPQKRLASFSLTSSYQNAVEMLIAISGAWSNRKVGPGTFKVPATASNPVTVSIVLPGATTGNNSLSNTFALGSEMPFSEIDLTYVWLKGSGGSSTCELECDDAS